jgi:hypothetical protein
MRTKTTRKVEKLGDIELVALRRKDIRRMPKPHPGFEQLVTALASLVRDYPNAIGRDGIDLDALAKDLAAVEALNAPCDEARLRLALLMETRFFYRSRAWSRVLLMYDRARSAARTNASIARAIRAFERFMKHKKKHVSRVVKSKQP